MPTKGSTCALGLVLMSLAGHADDYPRPDLAEVRPAASEAAAVVSQALAEAAIEALTDSDQSPVSTAPLAPLSTEWISANKDSAMDSGESAPISSPTGPRSLVPSALPASPSASSNRSLRALGPRTPM